MASRTEMTLHEACFRGDVERVRALLDEGADPNAPAEDDARAWVSCAGARPRPLNCVAIAHAMRDEHVTIARLLIDHGALVDATVLDDHAVDARFDAVLRANA